MSFERLWDGLPLDSLSDGASNTWVVHSTRTATGKPILANDPHLGFDAPVRWYLARIEAPDLTLVGATVPGVPFMILGHNGEIAWGFTNGRADAADLFVERLAPSDPDRYLTADGSRQFSVREEVILVDGSDPVTITVRESMHGPIISDVSEDAAGIVSAGHVISLTSASLWPDDRTAVAQLGINRARNWSEFRAAAGNIHTPHLNLFFAARDGEIAMISPGRIPIRRTLRPILTEVPLIGRWADLTIDSYHRGVPQAAPEGARRSVRAGAEAVPGGGAGAAWARGAGRHQGAGQRLEAQGDELPSHGRDGDEAGGRGRCAEVG